jgi:hypothetical protein
MRGSSGIDVSTRDVSLSLVCALGGRSVGPLFGRCRGVVAAADGELCRQVHKPCAWSSCPTCQYVTCTRHACAERFRRAVRGAWVAFRGRSVERGGYATRRYSHDASVACRDRPTSGRCERAASRPSGGRATRLAVPWTSLRIRIIAARHCPFPAFARFGFHVSRAVPGRAAVLASRRRYMRYIEHPPTTDPAFRDPEILQIGRTRERRRTSTNKCKSAPRLPRSPLRPGAGRAGTRDAK